MLLTNKKMWNLQFQNNWKATGKHSVMYDNDMRAQHILLYVCDRDLRPGKCYEKQEAHINSDN